jgi:tetratricopeptide (TPR) repeat protein
VDLLKRDPSSVDALLALAEVLLELGRRDDAATAVTRLLRLDPDHAGALFLRGVLLSDARRYREAIRLWQRVVELEPEGEYALRARREARTAADLLRIFRTGREAVS